MKLIQTTLAICVALGLATDVLAEDHDIRFVEVTGIGLVTQTPDQALVSFSVESQSEAVEAAAKKNALQANLLIDSLHKEGIERTDIQTRYYNVSPRYSDRRNREGDLKPIGYVVNNTVEVRVRDLDKLGGLIDKVVASGATRVQNVRFELSDPTSAREQALKLAMENARAEAEALVAMASAKLGKVLSIETEGGHHAPRMERAVMSAAKMDTPVEPGTLETRARVVVSFQILD